MLRVLIAFSVLFYAAQAQAQRAFYVTKTERTVKTLLTLFRDPHWRLPNKTGFRTAGIKIILPHDPEDVYFDPTVFFGKAVRIEFAYDSSFLRPEYFPLLNDIGRTLTNHAIEKDVMVIEGHTDSDGGEPYNFNLSLKRARAVKSFLITHFPIAPARIKIIGYGETAPLASNTSDLNKQFNRRATCLLPKFVVTCWGE